LDSDHSSNAAANQTCVPHPAGFLWLCIIHTTYACYSSPYNLLREKIKKWQPFRKVFENNQKKRGKPIFLWLSLLTDP